MYLLSFLGGRYAEFVCLLTFVVRYGLIASILSMLGHTYNKVDSALFAPINNGRHHQTYVTPSEFLFELPNKKYKQDRVRPRRVWLSHIYDWKKFF